MPGDYLNISSRVPSEGAPTPQGRLHGASSERSPTPRAPFILLSKSPVDEPSPGSPNGAPMERDACLQSLFYIFFRVPSKEALPPGSLHRAPTERDTTPPEPLPTISQGPRYRSPPPGSPNGAPMERDANLQSFYISFRVPSKEALCPGSLHRAPTERDTTPPEPLSTISQSPR